MRIVSKKIALIAFGVILMFTPISAQKHSRGNKAGLKDYLHTLTEQNRFIAECERKHIRSAYVPIMIAGHCEFGGSGCPVRLVMPRYPLTARELKLHSVVGVDVIADETGRIIYSKVIGGSNFFKGAAERAARSSRFTPTLYCGKAVKRQFAIRYNFVI